MRDILFLNSKISYLAYKVNKVFYDEIIASSDGETRRYLVRSKGKAPTDDAWIDLDAMERYESISTLGSTGSSLRPPGENNEDIQS